MFSPQEDTDGSGAIQELDRHEYKNSNLDKVLRLVRDSLLYSEILRRKRLPFNGANSEDGLITPPNDRIRYEKTKNVCFWGMTHSDFIKQTNAYSINMEQTCINIHF